MKIDLLCNDGSPLGVIPQDVYGEAGRIGIGGAELALMTMCEAWYKRGDQVVLYNNPRMQGNLFEQRWFHSFDPQEDRDILIIFRSPNHRAIGAKGLKVWWSCDQFTTGDYYGFSSQVDRIVCISPFHQAYFYNAYNITNSICIDLPVRTWDYEFQSVKKVPYRFLFSSVPDRGLGIVGDMWEAIQRKLPEATLHITSDYRLWGAPDPRNEKYRLEFLYKKGVKFLGAVNRRELIKEQLEAEILFYPCIYEELFCIAVAEAQIAGIYPITSGCGALETTNMGGMIPTDPVGNTEFRKIVFKMLEDLYAYPGVLTVKVADLYSKALERFGIHNILAQWDEKVFKEG